MLLLRLLLLLLWLLLRLLLLWIYVEEAVSLGHISVADGHRFVTAG